MLETLQTSILLLRWKQMEQEVNQQERPDLAWLTGIVEGEGSLYFSGIEQSKCGPDIYPRCNVYNTDPEIIDTICGILKKYEIGYYLQSHRIKGKFHGLYVHVNGIKRQQKFLSLIRPYMHSKKAIIVDKLLDYFKWKLQQPFHHFDKTVGYKLQAEIVKINESGILRDFMPNYIKVEDKVRSA